MEEDIAILTIHGSIDAHGAPEFDGKMKEIMKKTKKIVLDLSRLEYIATAGLGVLIASFNAAKSAGGDVIIACMTDKIKKVFDTMGFSKVLKSASAVAQAKLLFLN
jgi:anti-anti-sigma factor